MPKEPKRKKRNEVPYEVKIVFENKPSPEIYRQYIEGVISANIQEHVPTHRQEQLLNEFVKAGLMAP